MLEPSLTEPRAMPSKASSQYSPASSRAEQSLEYRPKPNRIEPDLSRAEPSWASSQAGPKRVAHWARVRPRAKWSRAPYQTQSQASPELILNKAERTSPAQQSVFPLQSAISIQNKKTQCSPASDTPVRNSWLNGIQTMFAPKTLIAPQIFLRVPLNQGRIQSSSKLQWNRSGRKL